LPRPLPSLDRRPDCAARLAVTLTVFPSRNGNHRIKKKDEKRDHRRLNTEW